MLSNTNSLVHPVFYNVVGTKKDEGTIIERGRYGVLE